MKFSPLVVGLTLVLLCSHLSAGSTYFVAPTGDDGRSGLSTEQAFRSISRAAAVVGPGDQVIISGGVYRETVELRRSGQAGRPITFRAAGDGPVVLDGSEPVTGPWREGADGIWRAKIDTDQPLEAVFFAGRMLVEARWPNCSWEDNWDPAKKWAATGEGTTFGTIRSEALAASGVDLSGGLLYIKLSKGNGCFTRPVIRHEAGAGAFDYDTTGIEGRAWREDGMPERIAKHGLVGNRYFVVARGALDAPGEWFHDVAAGELLLIPPAGMASAPAQVTVKQRTSGVVGRGVTDITIEGLSFFACNLHLEDSQRMILRHLDWLYPSTPRIFPDAERFEELHTPIRVHGAFNVIERCRVRWAIDGGLTVEGAGNRVEDCVVHDVNLHGRHPGPGISLSARNDQFPGVTQPDVIRHNTVYNVGSVGIYPSGRGVIEVGHNHIFNAGLHTVDISALYIPVGRSLGGTRLHHNWLHNVSGIGFRVDIQGRDLAFDHNLVWNTGAGGKLQGFSLRGFNNTVVVNNPAHPLIVVVEPDASAEERRQWRVQNNVAYSFLERRSLRGGYAEDDPQPFRRPLPARPGIFDHNVELVAGQEQNFFADPERFDFRPRAGGPLDGTGTTVTGGAATAAGRRPSIGALEAGQPFWQAGARWLPDGLPVPTTPAEATALARRLQPAGQNLGVVDRRYRRN